MFLTKGILQAKNIDVSIMGDDLISRMAIILASISNGRSEITNISVNRYTKNLIDIIKNFNIDIGLDEQSSMITVVGKGLYGYQQANNFINIDSSIENLLLILIVIANQDFKTFITGNDDFVNGDFSCCFDYLENVNLVFNKNKQLPMLCYGKKEFLTKNVFSTSSVFDKNLLLLSSFFSKKSISITDEHLQDETIEKVLSFLGVSMATKYFDKTNFFTRDTVKCKDIVIDKTTQTSLEGKDYTIPLNLKEVVYIIFLFMFLDDIEEITINGVLVNELNDTIIDILIENGVDIQHKKQRMIMNNIKVSDLLIKKSTLKPISISKDRIKKVLEFYPFLMLLNILNNNSLFIYGAKYIREYDEKGYNFIVNILKNFGYQIDEVRDNIEFISSDDRYSNIQYNHSIETDTDDNKANITLAFLLSGVKFNNKITHCNIDSMVDIFPNFHKVLQQFNIKLND